MGSGQSKKNKTSSPSEPTTSSPSEPTTSSPSEPTTSSPSEPTTSSLSEPTTSSPSEPTTSSLSEPTTSSPSEPTASSPSEPTRTSSKPVTNSTSEPTTSSTSEPRTSSPSEPRTSSTSEPRTSSPSEPTSTSSKPETNSTSEPRTSSISEPRTSSTSEPTSTSSKPETNSPSEATSSTSEPRTSSTSEPRTNSTSEQRSSSSSEPTASSPSEPTSTSSKPETNSPSEPRTNSTSEQRSSSSSEPTASSPSEPTSTSSKPETNSPSEPRTNSTSEQRSSSTSEQRSSSTSEPTTSSTSEPTSTSSKPETNSPSEPTTSSTSEPTTSSTSEPTTSSTSEPTTSSTSEPTSSSFKLTTSSISEPKATSTSEPTGFSSEPTSSSSKPETSYPLEPTTRCSSELTSSPSEPTSSSTSGSPKSSPSGLQTGSSSGPKTRSTSESEGPASLHEQPHDQSKSLQLLLVGCKGNGKSHTGNTILGLKVFTVTRKGGTQEARLKSNRYCMGDHVSRKVTVVDTPGVSQEMTESEFEELVRAVKMVPEGFDAICLVWDYDSSDKGEDKVKKEVQVSQSLHRLFGDGLYEHLVILVTHAQQEEITEFITGLPEAMREIVSDCGNHEHVLAIENKPDGDSSVNKGQIDKLFECIETMSGKYKDSDLICQIRDGKKLRIALVGKTGVGKSHTGNTIIGNDKFKEGDRASLVTTKCNFSSRTKDRKITVLDTPGVFSTDDHDRLVNMMKELCKMGACIHDAGGLDALGVVVSSRVKFTESETKAVKFFQHLFGSKFANYAILLVTGKDNLRETTENDFLTSDNMRTILEQCGNRCVFFDNTTRDETIKRQQLIKLIQMIDQRVAENRYKPYTDDLFQEGKKCMEGILEEAKNQNLTWSQIAQKLSKRGGKQTKITNC